METGIKSTSGKLTLAGLATGVGMIVTDYVQNTNGMQSKVDNIVGGVIAVGTVVAKLAHDRGIHVAAIAAGISDVEKEVPVIQKDFGPLLSELETEFPAVKTAVQAIDERVKALEGAATEAKVTVS